MRVAILGGGMAGLAAAWRLSEPDSGASEVTVYQRGWRLGGKGASSRGIHGRIEEHGLHVWLGYYDNAFRLLREVYGELDRPRSDPGCPIRAWEDGFLPASLIGLGSEDAAGWADWLAWFPENDQLPGEPSEGDDAMDAVDLARQVLALLGRFGASLEGHVAAPPRAVLSASPVPPVGAHGVDDLVAGIGTALRSIAKGGSASDRASSFVELLTALLRGMVVDGVLVRGFGAIDHLDLRDWLRQHGASEAAVASPFVRGAYDLTFAYEDGDLARPAIGAGTGLLLSGRMFLAYRGAMFWKMRAGMGDVVFAPLYEALRRRGVRFEFFHRLDGLHPSADGRRIDAVSLGRQVPLRADLDQYEPLVRVKRLPVFPDHVQLDQVDAPPAVARQPLEAHGCAWPDAGSVRLEVGRDYDHVVLAVSLGMLPHVASEIVAQQPSWRSLLGSVRTVATQAMQLWLRPDEHALGWAGAAATVTGCGAPFDTFASLSHTIPYEDWPTRHRPATAATFCAVLDERAATADDPEAAVLDAAVGYLDGPVGGLWPAARRPDGGFDWSLLCGADGATSARQAVATQHLRANVDPSDRYVLSVPGSAPHRLRADESGYDNLALAGDWIETGLNAGCIEAATLGGLQAANAVLGRPLHARTSGFRPRERTHA
ncbi:MAG: FAD-dependent oxidoreductase [Acidimicrobiales bacterium]